MVNLDHDVFRTIQRRNIRTKSSHADITSFDDMSSLEIWRTSFLCFHAYFLDCYQNLITSISTQINASMDYSDEFCSLPLLSWPVLSPDSPREDVGDKSNRIRQTSQTRTYTKLDSPPPEESLILLIDQIFEGLMFGDPCLIDFHIQYIFSVTSLHNTVAIRCSLDRIARIFHCYTDFRYVIQYSL